MNDKIENTFRKKSSSFLDLKAIKIIQTKSYIFSWGFSKYSQTGIENCQYCIEPTQLNFSTNQEIISLSSGEANSALILKDNSTYIFGKNTFGQLCNNTKILSSIPRLLPLKFSLISIGGEHILGLTEDNSLYTWGFNLFGQCGLGHNEIVSIPTLVEKLCTISEQENGLFIKEKQKRKEEIIIEISAGAQHSMILTNYNDLYTCGFARNGALGYLNTNSELDPFDNMLFTRVPIKKSSKTFSKISCGVNHSGCIVGSSEILIWGRAKDFEFDGIKQFDLSKTLSKVGSDAIAVNGTNDNSFNNSSPCGNYLIDFQLGENFLVLLSNNGEVYTLGANDFGQLGIGKKQLNRMVEKVKTEEKIKTISVGFLFVYAIGISGKVYAWGDNRYGQLLDIENDFISTPKEIKELFDFNPQIISCGGYHVISLCNKEIKQNPNDDKFINYKKIPLNSSFNPFHYHKKVDAIFSLIEISKKHKVSEMEIQEKEKMIIQLTKSIEEKSKIKAENDKERKKNSMKSNLNFSENMEKILEEEIQLKELTFPENDFLGGGAFGEVRKAYWRKTLVAVKFLKTSLETKENQVIPFIEEFNLLKRLRHPNILLFIGGCISGPQHFFVTEYCENGNLFELLHGTMPLKLNNPERIHLALEIAKGVNYLHCFDPPVLHRDLKSLNILVNKNYEIKIADFGWARLRNKHMTRLRGTFQWMAPEVILKENYTEKADVYSFGIVLWEFWSIDPPYKNVIAKEVANNVKKDRNYRPIIPPDVPSEISSLMKRCWDHEPTKRPTFSEIINDLEDFLINS